MKRPSGGVGASKLRATGRWAVRVRRLFLAVLVVSGCGAEDRSDQPLLVLAAASLTGAMEAVEVAYEAASGQPLTVVFGSSGNLAAQIRHGAPADVYVSANERFFDELASEGFLDPSSRVEVAVGRLALVTPPGRPAVERLEALADPSYQAVAMANPEHAPYGGAARSALQAVGIWEALEGRVVMGENVAQAFQYVRTGNADAGLVALSLVVSPQGGPGTGAADAPPYTVVAEALHPPLSQIGGVVSGSRRPQAAAGLLAWLAGPEGRRILGEYGFEAPAS